jgi:hypothetical protein
MIKLFIKYIMNIKYDINRMTAWSLHKVIKRVVQDGSPSGQYIIYQDNIKSFSFQKSFG